MKPPSQKQLDYLRILGYEGRQPESSSEASRLIDDMKSGAISPTETPKERKQRIAENRAYIADLEEMIQQGEGAFKCAGFRLKAIKGETPRPDLIYDNAFLPLDTAKKCPELLSLVLACNELERTPKKGLVVIRPGVVRDIEKASVTGCLLVLVCIAAGGTLVGISLVLG